MPAEQATGWGPRCSAWMGEVAGTYGNGRRMVQPVCGSVLGVSISLGAIQKVLDRVAQTIEPHDTAMALQARQAVGNSMDEMLWFCTHTLHELWGMASARVAFYMVYLRCSKEAFAALIDDWAGILVSDGYGVCQHWVARRQVAWCICSARTGAWWSAHRPSGPLVELGHVPSYNASAIGLRLHPRAESGVACTAR